MSAIALLKGCAHFSPPCELRAWRAFCDPTAMRFLKSQVESEAIETDLPRLLKMNSSDNQTPTDDTEDAWESLGEIIARLLRGIAPERDAA